MDLKDLDRLVEKYDRQGYQQIRVKAGDLEIEVSRQASVAEVPAKLAVSQTAPADEAQSITSPMVGVMHLSPDLSVGQTVTKGQELGQIESMKLFNPLVCPQAGILTAILVEDGAAVEFGQSLFKMREDR
ncbi:acetyl-CoA carboxylase biotin carboxyl carrier protein [Lactiplantibacillus nangangensis]|uniref:Acetyl-CoA carboxylase biotin carboxyl carrier protein n=1 Tax=Lactiplantibacillus nangangensis TaxID=2559917 RepID=A0ABW1SI75_9LACO|nr:acetyl-CoA carboxylase biotin carboxyl carrier protein subunit [Lactiplantibacillus nangangensis]